MADLTDILNINIETQTRSYKKGQILQHEGDVTNNAFYVRSGLLRTYSIDEKGKEHIFLFAPEGWIIADIESQEFQRPAQLFVECLEDSEVIIFDRNCFFIEDLRSEQRLTQITMLSRRLGMMQRRLIMMMSAPAIERYDHFLETYPELSNRVPQRMIASYLGITPEALSKIRGMRARAANPPPFLNRG